MSRLFLLLILLNISSTLYANCSVPRYSPVVGADDLIDESENDAIGTTGSAYVFSSGDFDKPVLVVEGFDPTNAFGCTEMYWRLNENFPFSSSLSADGRDLVIVDFDSATVSMENNAIFLQKLITQINDDLDGEHSLSVIGLSMGGVVSRFALTRMESQGISHNTFLFASYDSPQKFANIPTEIQVWLGIGASLSIDEFTRALYRDFLWSIVTKELLATYRILGIDADLTYGIDITDHNNNLRSKIADLDGYPIKLRKVAFANGNAYGLEGKYDFEAGDNILHASDGQNGFTMQAIAP